MSALIKSGDAPAIRAFARDAARDPEPLAAADPREAEVAALRGEIARLTKALTEARVQAKADADKAREEGRKVGLAEAEEREEDRIDALRRGIDDATEAFDQRLELLDGLAPQLARAALDKLFAPADRFAEMVEAMLARQLGQLRRSSVVAIAVSPKDFADPSALAAALGTGEVAVALDSDLASGACRIDCRLGQIDLDVRAQWAELSALLEQMAERA